jgi:phosphoribosylaminoimidazole carboxylase PurE protein
MKALIIMGSDSDLPVMEEAAKLLEEFGIDYEMTVASAHRTPERAVGLASGAERRGVGVIIAGAGMAAHLAGVLAAHTIVPVIGVPINSSPLNGMDALLSTVQMPPGVPVATVSIGKAGAKNAAVLAAQILARKDRTLAAKLRSFRKKMANAVEKKAEGLKDRQKGK